MGTHKLLYQRVPSRRQYIVDEVQRRPGFHEQRAACLHSENKDRRFAFDLPR